MDLMEWLMRGPLPPYPRRIYDVRYSIRENLAHLYSHLRHSLFIAPSAKSVLATMFAQLKTASKEALNQTSISSIAVTLPWIAYWADECGNRECDVHKAAERAGLHIWNDDALPGYLSETMAVFGANGRGTCQPRAADGTLKQRSYGDEWVYMIR